jgi:hypothetical protein
MINKLRNSEYDLDYCISEQDVFQERLNINHVVGTRCREQDAEHGCVTCEEFSVIQEVRDKELGLVYFDCFNVHLDDIPLPKKPSQVCNDAQGVSGLQCASCDASGCASCYEHSYLLEVPFGAGRVKACFYDHEHPEEVINAAFALGFPCFEVDATGCSKCQWGSPTTTTDVTLSTGLAQVNYCDNEPVTQAAGCQKAYDLTKEECISCDEFGCTNCLPRSLLYT